MYFKQLKINNLIYDNIEREQLKEQFQIETIEQLKPIAIDTIEWQIGNNVSKALGNTNVNLSASNAKGIVLLAKIIDANNLDTAILSQKENEAYSNMLTLASNGYSDSNLLVNSLKSVQQFIADGTLKIEAIVAAQTIDEIIEILNNKNI